MNQVLLTGRVATEPKFVETSTHVCSFRIAVKRALRSADEARDFFTIVAWAGLADACHKHLDLGREVSVGGRLRTRSYAKDGETHWVTEVVADRIEFMGARKPATHDDAEEASHAALATEQQAEDCAAV